MLDEHNQGMESQAIPHHLAKNGSRMLSYDEHTGPCGQPVDPDKAMTLESLCRQAGFRVERFPDG
eukprot:8053264-Prorocentrum_lima.AAC.1